MQNGWPAGSSSTRHRESGCACAGLGAECDGAPFKLADLGASVQIQVKNRRSRPRRRLAVLDALHHENHAARLDGCAVLMGPQQRACQETGVEARQFLMIGAIQGNGRHAEGRARLVPETIVASRAAPAFAPRAPGSRRGHTRLRGTIMPTRVKISGPHRCLIRGFWCTPQSMTRADRAAVRACSS